MSVLSKKVFAKNLRKLMEGKGINQKELAEIIGVSAPTMNDWLQAKKYPRIDKIEKLADYFGVLKSDLIEKKSEVNTEKNCLITIGQRIQQRRKEINMSADELAKKLGIDRSTIYRYENGDIKKIPLDILEPIAKALNTTPTYLMDYWDIGQKIKNARLLHGLTQEQLGNLVGVQKSAIAKYENGRVVNIKRNTLQKIATVLGINIQELIFDDLPIDTTELHSKILTDFELLKSIKDYYELSDEDKKMIRDLISRFKK